MKHLLWRERRRLVGLVGVAVLAACIQGFWHRRAENPWDLVAYRISAQAAFRIPEQHRLLVDANPPALTSRPSSAIQLAEEEWEAQLPDFLEKWNPANPTIIVSASAVPSAGFRVRDRLVLSLIHI